MLEQRKPCGAVLAGRSHLRARECPAAPRGPRSRRRARRRARAARASARCEPRGGRTRTAGRTARGRSSAALLAERPDRVLAEHGALQRRACRGSRRSSRQASRSGSTNVALAAPRESASRPIAPEPANRSSTSASSTGPIRLNAFSRTRSEVGRVSRPFGAAMRWPRWVPAMILMTGAGADPTRRCTRRRQRLGLVLPGPVLVAELACELARLLDQVAVPRSFVKRRSLQPDWRVPSSWPSRRSSRSASASSKPSVVSTSAWRRACATRSARACRAR